MQNNFYSSLQVKYSLDRHVLEIIYITQYGFSKVKYALLYLSDSCHSVGLKLTLLEMLSYFTGDSPDRPPQSQTSS